MDKLNKTPLTVVEISGPPRVMGQQQGEGCREKNVAAVKRYCEIISKVVGITWEEAVREARKFLPYAEEAFPSYVEELRGLAEGAGLSFHEVWTLNCYEGLTETHQQVWGCTCMAVCDDQTRDGHVLLAHNEDWSSIDSGNVYLVRARPNDGPPFIGMTYGPLLVNIGLNAEGIGVAINSVYPTDGRVGVPRVLCSRAVLGARTIGQAIRACVPKLRAGGYAYLLADPNGEIYVVETSATRHHIAYGDDGWLVHTNHYLSAKMQDLEVPGPYSSSSVRLNRARRLLRARLGQVTVEDLQAILRDHVNYPNSICVHEDLSDQPYERDVTLASLVMDLTDRLLWAAPGPPCQSEYRVYSL